MCARTHTQTHIIHSLTHWAWVWVLTDPKKTSQWLRKGHFQRSRKIWHLTFDDLMRTHAHSHISTEWACVWTFTDLQNTYPGLRTKSLKYQKFLVLLPHFSMEYNVAHLV